MVRIMVKQSNSFVNQINTDKGTSLRSTWRDEVFVIPNIICYFRFLMIPLFIILYQSATDHHGFYLAGSVLIIASITDKIDGTIARKYNMITNLGKIIDPLADKLLQGAVAFCLTTSYPAMWILLGVFFAKEMYMGVMGIRNLQSGMEVYGAKWYGKLCTVVLFLSMIVLVFFKQIPFTLVHIIIAVNIIFMLYSLFMYWLEFRRMRTDDRKCECER